MDLVGKRLDVTAPALDDADGMIWRNYAGLQLKGGRLFLDAKGTGPGDARLFLVATADDAYEVQVEVTVPAGGSGGLILFYNETAFAGLTSDGKEFTLYHDAARVAREPNPFGGHFFLKIINRLNRCVFLAGADGKTWVGLLSDVDVSGLQHKNFTGFLTLRPGLMAAGGGKVRFDRFVYKNISNQFQTMKPTIQTKRINSKL